MSTLVLHKRLLKEDTKKNLINVISISKKPYKCYCHSYFVTLFQFTSKRSLSLQNMSARVLRI